MDYILLLRNHTKVFSRHKLFPQGAGTFNIGPSSGIVKLAKELDFEDLRQPHIYQLLVTATEDSGGFSTSVELTIRVSDVNDNAPKFELPDYQAHNIDEDIAIGTSILKVKASDADSGSNADIAYSVSDDHFAVNSDGLISNNRRLGGDSNNAYYEFQVGCAICTQPNFQLFCQSLTHFTVFR